MKTKKPKTEDKKGSRRVKAILNKMVPFEEWIKTPRTEAQIEMYHRIKKEAEGML